MNRRFAFGATAATAIAIAMLGAGACTQETQNQLGRAVQNWTGTDGVLDILAGEKVYMRFIKIDKVSTAGASSGSSKRARPYRFGYGYVDRNFNFRVDPGEKKVYFEISDYSTPYVFYANDKE